MRTIASILFAGAAFALSAYDPAAAVHERPRFQYSSYADDTALYTGAYREAETQMAGQSKAGGIGSPATDQDSRSGTITAGTISHHLLIRNLIAQYFIELARNAHPGTIIIIGPNHHARGHSPVAVSALRWRTPFGLVEPDTQTIRTISETGLACVDEEAFFNEHSIGALVPFIRRTFPGARIVPIVFKKSADRDACVKLGATLSGLVESTLVLASLDFSHYRTSLEAGIEDAASLDIFLSLSLERVDKMFVDSRPAMLTLMSLCRNADMKRIQVVQHTNSGILSRRPRVPCTSYINSYIRR